MRLRGDEKVASYTCFWPGLTSAWHRGASSGLLMAVLYSWFLCGLLLATFFWTHWLSTWQLVTLWVAAVLIWLVGVVRAQWAWSATVRNYDHDTDQAFCQAQAEYLKGNWFEAEARLLEIVQHEPRDVAAGLLLVGVLRHTQRWQPALRRLEQLNLLDAAVPWHHEISQERMLIARAQESAQDVAPSPDTTEQPANVPTV